MDHFHRLVTTGCGEYLHGSFDYNHHRSLVALVRAAYLLMFRYFGYRYVLDDSAKPIRWQIENPMVTTPVLDAIMWRSNFSIPAPSAATIVQKPVRLHGFVIMLELDADSNHQATVGLPPPGMDGSIFYNALRSRSSRGRITAKFIPVPVGEFLPYVELYQLLTRSPKQRKGSARIRNSSKKK